MTLSIILADDEPLALDRLTSLLRAAPGVDVVGIAVDGDEAASLIASAQPDLALLDIRMPHRSGLALARALAQQPDRRTDVVFVTAFNGFALEAFELDAADYLLKPVEAVRLKAALARARRRRTLFGALSAGNAPLPGLWAPSREGQVRVAFESIVWIEAAGDYALIHTPSRSHMLRATLEALLRQLPQGFARVSRSAIVRTDAVTAALRRPRGGLALQVGDGETLVVGQSYVPAVKHLFPPPPRRQVSAPPPSLP